MARQLSNISTRKTTKKRATNGGPQKTINRYRLRSIIGHIEGYTCYSGKDEIDELRKACLDKKGKISLSKFAKFLRSELSFSSWDLKTSALRKVFPVEWSTKKGRQLPRPANKINVRDLQFETAGLSFSIEIEWHDVPIHSDIIDDDMFAEALREPTDLLDHTWFNDDGLKLAPDIYTNGINNFYIVLMD
jgi:hypothetical protein